MLALLSACGQHAERESDYHRLNLPGFSVEVPEAIVVSTSNSPSSGKHTMKFAEPSLFETTFEKMHDPGKLVLEWNSQSYSREEWKKVALPALVDTFKGKVPDSGGILREKDVGKDRWLYVVGQALAPVGFGVVDCDPSFAVWVTLARYRDVDRTAEELERIVKSVQCTVGDANRARPSAATRLPAKFGKTPDHDVQIFQALDGEQFIVNFSQSDVQRDPVLYRKLMRSLLANALGTDVPDSSLEILPAGLPKPAGKSSLMRANFPATNESLYVGTQYCPDVGLSLISIWSSPRATDQLARERQSQIGCPGEESSASPPFSSLADAACEAGEKQLCGLKEMPQ